MPFDTEATAAMVAAAKDLTIHATHKSPSEVAEAFKLIYSAIVDAIAESQESSVGSQRDKPSARE